jgi:hypothetical protein
MDSSLLHIRCLPRWFWPICLGCFLLAAWGGRRWFKPAPTPLPPPPITKITLIFHVYDTRGRELSGALLTGPTDRVARQRVEGSNCQLTKTQGSTLDLIFAYQGKQKVEHVVWRSEGEYRRWLERNLLENLKALDPSYNKQNWLGIADRFRRRAAPTKYDYPVVFSTPP